MEMSLPKLNINAIMYVGNLVHAVMHKMVVLFAEPPELFHTEQAIDSLKNRNAPGKGGISGEFF